MMMTQEQRSNIWTLIALHGIAAVLCFVAVAQLPYGYYQFLRLFVTGASLLAIVFALETRRVAIVIYVVIAILFNPLAPIHLDKQTWTPIDIAVGIMFLALGGWGIADELKETNEASD